MIVSIPTPLRSEMTVPISLLECGKFGSRFNVHRSRRRSSSNHVLLLVRKETIILFLSLPPPLFIKRKRRQVSGKLTKVSNRFITGITQSAKHLYGEKKVSTPTFTSASGFSDALRGSCSICENFEKKLAWKGKKRKDHYRRRKNKKQCEKE